MNIGIDIDDTIVNTYDMFLKLICMKYVLNYNNLLKKKFKYNDIFKRLNNFDDIKRDLFSILGKSVGLKEDVVKVGIKTLRFSALFNERVNEFPKVYSWNQVYNIIKCL